MRVLSSPLRLAGTPPRINRPAPVFGQHSAEVLAAYGYSAEDISALHDSGALFDAGLAQAAPMPADA
jgi:formyl-CoA transferase